MMMMVVRLRCCGSCMRVGSVAGDVWCARSCQGVGAHRHHRTHTPAHAGERQQKLALLGAPSDAPTMARRSQCTPQLLRHCVGRVPRVTSDSSVSPAHALPRCRGQCQLHRACTRQRRPTSCLHRLDSPLPPSQAAASNAAVWKFKAPRTASALPPLRRIQRPAGAHHTTVRKINAHLFGF